MLSSSHPTHLPVVNRDVMTGTLTAILWLWSQHTADLQASSTAAYSRALRKEIQTPYFILSHYKLGFLILTVSIPHITPKAVAGPFLSTPQALVLNSIRELIACSGNYLFTFLHLAALEYEFPGQQGPWLIILPECYTAWQVVSIQ